MITAMVIYVLDSGGGENGDNGDNVGDSGGDSVGVDAVVISGDNGDHW